jgi:hypothetical protein
MINIHEMSLLDALHSPFYAVSRTSSFQQQFATPCPHLDNPEKLVAMVNTAGVYSTQRGDNEPVE